MDNKDYLIALWEGDYYIIDGIKYEVILNERVRKHIHTRRTTDNRHIIFEYSELLKYKITYTEKEIHNEEI